MIYKNNRVSRIDEIGFTLKRIRKQRKINAKDLAPEVGVTQSTIYAMENGEDVRLSTIKAVANEYGYVLALKDKYTDKEYEFESADKVFCDCLSMRGLIGDFEIKIVAKRNEKHIKMFNAVISYNGETYNNAGETIYIALCACRERLQNMYQEQLKREETKKRIATYAEEYDRRQKAAATAKKETSNDDSEYFSDEEIREHEDELLSDYGTDRYDYDSDYNY